MSRTPIAGTERDFMEQAHQHALERIREIAAALAAEGPGSAADLATEVAAALIALSARIDALWQLITAVVESAGLSVPEASAPPPDYAAALASARRTGRRGVRLSIDGKEWVAALSQQVPDPDPASWSAIERLARRSDQDEM
jgi:hypothetical protein